MGTSNKGNGFALLVVGGVFLFGMREIFKGSTDRGPATSPGFVVPPGAVEGGKSLPPKAPEPEPVAPPATLAELLRRLRPNFADSENQIDRPSILFAIMWAKLAFPWAQLMVVPETTFGKLKKDPDAERGKRLCASGTIAEITDASGELPKRSLYGGKLVTEGSNVITFFALGSTGDLVEDSYGRFCGIATGLYSYSNAGGGTTHSVLATGFFDLPANKVIAKSAAAQAPAPKTTAASLGTNYVSPITSGHLPIYQK